MTATINANMICDDIEDGMVHGQILPSPRTSWCAWENDFCRFVITVFHGINGMELSRNEFDEMVAVFQIRFGVRLSYVQETGVFVTETFHSESGLRETPQEIYRDDESNSVIDR